VIILGQRVGAPDVTPACSHAASAELTSIGRYARLVAMNTNTTALLDVTGLAKKYDGRAIVSDFCLQVQAGAAVALIGANGSGKSTVLRCLSGHEDCRYETFAARGRPIKVHSASYRRDVLPIFDDFAFFPDITVLEHLELLAAVHSQEMVGAPGRGATGDQAIDQADDAGAALAALARFGVEDVADDLPSTLSSGQIRRVAFASAAIRPWNILLLDEPEQRLDDEGRHRVIVFLKEQLGRGRGVVLATHDLAMVAELGAQTISLAR
jgi:ABC-2 type transport system ATP-binding protein